MMIFVWGIILIVSLALLVKSADFFVKYSEKLGLALGLSSFVVGATIVAIGTSAPELVSSLFAVLDAGVTEFVVDNVIGSNIANAMLILGIGAIYAKEIKVRTSLIDIDLPFFFSSMALFTYFVYDGNITRWEGVLLLAFFFIFSIYSAKASEDPEAIQEDKQELHDLKEQFNNKPNKKNSKHSKNKNAKNNSKIPYFKYFFYIGISVAVISASAKYLIDSVLTLSELLGVSSSMLTITVVAIGTSLPEVITSIAAIKIGNHGIALGNVFGSNTFNLTLVVGLPALFTDLQIANSTLVIALPFLVLATFIAIFVTFDNRVRFWEGVAMLFMFLVFIFKITNLI